MIYYLSYYFFSLKCILPTTSQRSWCIEPKVSDPHVAPVCIVTMLGGCAFYIEWHSTGLPTCTWYWRWCPMVTLTWNCEWARCNCVSPRSPYRATWFTHCKPWSTSTRPAFGFITKPHRYTNTSSRGWCTVKYGSDSIHADRESKLNCAVFRITDWKHAIEIL